MKKIEAPTLQDAYTKATEELGCSITDLDFEIVQNSSRGFLGLFKKNAIIIAKCKDFMRNNAYSKRKNPPRSRNDYKKETPRESQPAVAEAVLEPQREKRNHSATDAIVNSFNQGDMDPSVLDDILYDIKRLFAQSCFEIAVTEVEYFDEKTVKIKFDGADAALLIGKEGYRYKALSYMLFNWINPKYSLLLRLEIAEFLQNQEEQIRKYLEPIKNNIQKSGKGQTKPLDGVLVQIALKELRAAFPEKYVAIRNNSLGEKYIIVNEFASRQ
jgi:spoIIIJ-associated protein